MKLKQKTAPGVCMAMRCKDAAVQVFEDGTALCARHAAQYTPGSAAADTAPTTPAGDGSEATATLPVRVRAEVLTPNEAAAGGFVEQLRVLPTISSPEQLAAIGELAAYAQRQIKDLEDRRKALVAPLVKAQREANAWFKPAVDLWESAKGMLHKMIEDHRRLALEAQTAALASGDHATAMALPQPELPVGTHIRKVWIWRVVDPAQVPREFWAIDAARVQAVVDAQREKTSIPGIQVFEGEKLVTRGAK